MKPVSCDYAELKQLIRYKCGTFQNFASKMGMSYLTLYGRFTGRSEFRTSEILTAAKILNLKKSDIGRYFLTAKVAQVKPSVSSYARVAQVEH